MKLINKKIILKSFFKIHKNLSLYLDLLNEINIKNYLLVLTSRCFINLLDVINIGLLVSIVFNNSFLNILPDFDQLLSKKLKVGFLIAFLLIRNFLKLNSNIFSKNIILIFSDQLKEKMFSKIINANNEDLNKFSKNELINSIGFNVDRSVSAINQGTIFIQNIFSFVIYSVSLVFISKQSIFFVVLAIGSTLIASFFQNYNAEQIGIIRNSLILNIQKIIGDSLNGLKSIKALNATDWIFNRLQVENANNRELSQRIFKTQLFYKFFGEIIILFIFIFWLLKNAALYELSYIVTTILLLLRLSNSFTNIIESQRRLDSSIVSYLEIKKINLNLKSNYYVEYGKNILSSNLFQQTISKVQYIHKQNEKLKLELNLKRSSICVLVGNSGVGKTTILDLFSGLFNPKNSSWKFKFMNGKFYQSSGEEGAYIMRNLFSYATQDVFLIEGSLKENLLLKSESNNSNKSIIDNEIRNFLIKLDLKNILYRDYSLRKNINLTLDFFSGGEKKRLALIRAFLKDKSIEIYDEPTSYLDEEGGKKVINLLKERSKEKIIIISSHDEKLIDIADQVININDYKDLINSLRKT